MEHVVHCPSDATPLAMIDLDRVSPTIRRMPDSEAPLDVLYEGRADGTRSATIRCPTCGRRIPVLPGAT